MKTLDDELNDAQKLIDEKNLPQKYLDSDLPVIEVVYKGTDYDEHMQVYSCGMLFHTKNKGSIEKKVFVKRFDENNFREVRK